jgi:hypothetical protein
MSQLTRSSLLLGVLVAVAGSSASSAAAPAIGDGSVLAPIAPAAHACAGQPGCNGGFPEGVAVVGDRVYVAGPATFGTAGKGPSVVTVLNRANGALITEILIAGEQLGFEHALSGIAVDAAGDVFVVSTQLGVIRIHRHGQDYQQSAYAPPLPDLPACAPGGATPCTPTLVDSAAAVQRAGVRRRRQPVRHRLAAGDDLPRAGRRWRDRAVVRQPAPGRQPRRAAAVRRQRHQAQPDGAHPLRRRDVRSRPT